MDALSPIVSAGPIVNFGGNVRFTPRHAYAPRTEAQVLAILARHARGKVRAVGALHAWSPAVVSDDAVVDMRHFDQVDVQRHADGNVWATVGAGCTIKRLLTMLHAVRFPSAGSRKGDEQTFTIPSLGLITEQSIAGAVSTATHGSGRHSLSHYVDALRVAAYDAAGRPCIHTFAAAKETPTPGGDALSAARCALGCMGLILSVRFRCVPRYDVAETMAPCSTLEEVLAGEAAWPLQQFYLVPHRWSYFAQRRVVTPLRPRRSLAARLFRAWWLLSIDIGLHVVIKTLADVLRSPGLTRFFFRRVLPNLILKNTTVVDRGERMLVMEHELFRHLEIELFVSASRLRSAAAFIRAALEVFAGAAAAPPEDIAAALETIGMLDELLRRRGTFTHHYPIAFRRVLPDDALISMAEGNEPSYAISFITYAAPRGAFLAMASFLARSMARLFAARPHWGKHCPLTGREVEALYPRLPEFRAHCRTVDPNGVFRNPFTERLLFGASAAAESSAPPRDSNRLSES